MIETCGTLRHETSDALQGWIDACVAAGLIVISTDRYRTLSLTPGREVMSGRRADFGIVRPAPLPDPAALRESLGNEDEDDEFELEMLRRWLMRRWR